VFFEPLTVVLMRSLHAAGFSAEALATYANARQRLRDELGTEPGDELRKQQLSILRATSGMVGPRRYRRASRKGSNPQLSDPGPRPTRF
jgi:DNA-binding SARP family transcriptional activator